MRKHVLSRRTVLRGSAYGVAAIVGLPALDAMLNNSGDALAAGTPLPKRFGEFFWGNGVVANLWFPTATGAGWQLSPGLQPFVNVKDYISIVSGTVVYLPYGVPGHFGSLLSITSAAPGQAQGGLNYAYTAKSMDQVVADKIGTTTRFRSLEIGVASTDASDADFGAVAKSLSHNGANSPNLPQHDPIALYDRVFGTGFTAGTPDAGTPVSSVTLANRRSVLDLVAADTKTLQARLGTADRQRLDQHLQGILDLEKQLGGTVTTPTGACVLPTRPPSSYPSSGGQTIQWEPLSTVQTQLLVLALACDQTRVFTYRFSPCNDFTVYPGFPTFTIDPTNSNTGTSMHAMTHTQSGDQPGVQSCLLYAMSKFAAMLELMLATKEGAGSLLDNCAILGFSECTEGRSHNATAQPGIPMIVAGRAGGALVHPGIHYKSPLQGDISAESNGRNTGVVPLTLMQAVGAGITSWGSQQGTVTKVISELLV